MKRRSRRSPCRLPSGASGRIIFPSSRSACPDAAPRGHHRRMAFAECPASVGRHRRRDASPSPHARARSLRPRPQRRTLRAVVSWPARPRHAGPPRGQPRPGRAIRTARQYRNCRSRWKIRAPRVEAFAAPMAIFTNARCCRPPSAAPRPRKSRSASPRPPIPK